jgi:carboxyl-terminal processing protease
MELEEQADRETGGARPCHKSAAGPVVRSALGGVAAVLIGIGMAGAAVAPVPEATRRSSTPISSDLALASFDAAWTRIKDTYYDPDFRGLNWEAVRDELRPLAAKAGTEDELRAVIRKMLDRIGDSHFVLIPYNVAGALESEALRSGEQSMPSDAGFEVRLVEGALTVIRIEEGGAAAAAGVRPGWVVEAIGDREVAPWLEAVNTLERDLDRNTARTELVWRAGQLLQGPEGSTIRLRFRDAQDRIVDRPLTRRRQTGEPVRFGSLPTMIARLEHRHLPAGDACVGLIRFNIWMTPIAPTFERALSELIRCQGIVLDLRGNPGGLGAMVMGISGYFVDEVVSLGVMKTRESELRFVSNPRRATSAGQPMRPYGGPMAVLIDAMSASTSEIFAAGMQAIGRARLFGGTTAGQALPAMMTRLPNQDVLLHAFADFTGPDGVRIEGRGAIPDQPVPLTRADLLAERDRPLEAAIEWMREMRNGACGTRNDSRSSGGMRNRECPGALIRHD